MPDQDGAGGVGTFDRLPSGASVENLRRLGEGGRQGGGFRWFIFPVALTDQFFGVINKVKRCVGLPTELIPARHFRMRKL